MFKWFNPNVEILLNRVKDCERLCESLLAENKRLEMELEKSQNQSSYLQEKIFDLVGINKPQINIDINQNKEPIQIGNRNPNWVKTRQSLEQKSQEEAWKKRQEVLAAKENPQTNIEELEKEIGITNASKVS